MQVYRDHRGIQARDGHVTSGRNKLIYQPCKVVTTTEKSMLEKLWVWPPSGSLRSSDPCHTMAGCQYKPLPCPEWGDQRTEDRGIEVRGALKTHSLYDVGP